MDVFNSALKNPLPPQRKRELTDKTPPMRDRSPPDEETRRKKNSRRKHRNSHLGCGTCKKRRIKCDENLPQCFNCVKGKLHCAYLNLDAHARNALRMAQFNQNLRQDRLDEPTTLAAEAPDPAREPAPDRQFVQPDYYPGVVQYAVPGKGQTMPPMLRIAVMPSQAPLLLLLLLLLQVPQQIALLQIPPQILLVPLQMPQPMPPYPMVQLQPMLPATYLLMPVRMMAPPQMVYSDGMPPQPMMLVHEGDRAMYETYAPLVPMVPMPPAPPAAAPSMSPQVLLLSPPAPVPTASPVLPRISALDPPRSTTLPEQPSLQPLNRASSILKLLT